MSRVTVIPGLVTFATPFSTPIAEQALVRMASTETRAMRAVFRRPLDEISIDDGSIGSKGCRVRANSTDTGWQTEPIRP